MEDAITTLTCALTLLSIVFLGAEPERSPPREPPFSPSFQAPAPDARQPTFGAAASLVVLNVTVTDGDDLATGLSRTDFEVYEDGVRQPIQFFGSTRAPLDLILLLDSSSSMRGKMPLVRRAANDFMKVLAPGDRGAVVAFTHRVRILQGLTADREAIASAIDLVKAEGSTALHTALYIALKEFGKPALHRGEVRRQAIAVLSDGADTSSLVGIDEVLALARRTGVNIYTIRLESAAAGEDDAWSPTARSMQSLAMETGARTFSPKNVPELRNAYAAIARELRSQYTLAYAPENGRPDGRFRHVRVRLPFHPELRPRTRTGYAVLPTRATR